MQIPMKTPQFGRRANAAEFEQIKSYMSEQGLPGAQLDPACTEIVRKSPVPVWNFLRNTLPDLKQQWGFKNTLQEKSAETDAAQPLAAVLTRYGSKKHAGLIHRFLQKRILPAMPQDSMQAFQPTPKEVLLVLDPKKLDKKA